jgi:hypothetical protein
MPNHELHTGLLFLAEDKATPTAADKARAACVAFVAKYGTQPALVQMHPAQAAEIADGSVFLESAVPDGCNVPVEGSPRVAYRDYVLVIGPVPGKTQIDYQNTHGEVR